MSIEIPFNLRPIATVMDHLKWANRAVLLVQQVKDADARGLLSYRRVAEVLSELNSYLCIVVADLMEIVNNPRLFVLREFRYGKSVVGPTGTLADVSKFSAEQRSYTTLYESMCEVELI